MKTRLCSLLFRYVALHNRCNYPNVYAFHIVACRRQFRMGFVVICQRGLLQALESGCRTLPTGRHVWIVGSCGDDFFRFSRQVQAHEFGPVVEIGSESDTGSGAAAPPGPNGC